MIQVLRRVKDKNGAILYFDCIEDGIAVKYKLDDLIGLQNYLVNAYVRG